MNKPRLVILTTAWRPFIGGAEIAVEEIIRQEKNNFSFVIVTARLKRNLPVRDLWEGIPVYRLGWGCRWDKIWLIKFAPLLLWWWRQQNRVDLVWAIMASYAGAAAMFASYLGVPYVLTLQEGDDLAVVAKRVRWFSFWFKKIFERASGSQAIAPFLADWAKKQGARVLPVVIPNGVSCSAFHLSTLERANARQAVRTRLRLPVDGKVIITVSRLVKKNGINNLLAAVENLPQVFLIIVGEGELRPELEDQAAPFSSRVCFVGTQNNRVLADYLAAADVFCRPSLSEGQGIVFLEAMCAGLPVVATEVGGIPSMITNGANGLLVSPQDIPALQAALATVLNSSGLSEKLSKAGRKTVADFAWDKLAPRFQAWFTAVLENLTIKPKK